MIATDGLESTGSTVPVSVLRDLANRTMGTKGLIPLWFGEPDVATPEFIVEPAHKAMLAGKTTYVEGLGKPWLREAIAEYMCNLHAAKIDTNRIAVTVSGTNAVNLAFQLLLEPGDKVVTTTPSFPTLMAVPTLQHAAIETVPLWPGGNGWSLDLEMLLEKASNSKILLLNSPNNPTGFMLERDEIRKILDACRKSGTWIISDEVYVRIVYEESVAPSFAEIAEPEDRLIIINSFSKSWAMTGWRLGWLTLPPSLLHECEKLMEFSMSCAPEFVQAGGLAAIQQGEEFISSQIAKYRKGRDLALQRLAEMPSIRCIPPRAAFYVFFQMRDVPDNVGLAEELALKAGVGIAPGIAFETSLKDWFRICFANEETLLSEAFDRMGRFLNG